MTAVPSLAVTILILTLFFFPGVPGAVFKSKGLLLPDGNGTIKEKISRVNITRPGLIVLSLEIAKAGQNITNTGGQENPFLNVLGSNDDDTLLKNDEFYVPTKSTSLFRFKDVSTHSLYFVASISLFVLLLMIIKLALSRREKTKEYNLVTKGDFEA